VHMCCVYLINLRKCLKMLHRIFISAGC